MTPLELVTAFSSLILISLTKLVQCAKGRGASGNSEDTHVSLQYKCWRLKPERGRLVVLSFTISNHQVAKTSCNGYSTLGGGGGKHLGLVTIKDGAEPILASFSGTSLVTSAFVLANRWGHKVEDWSITNTWLPSPFTVKSVWRTFRPWENHTNKNGWKWKWATFLNIEWSLPQPKYRQFSNSGVTILFLYYVSSQWCKSSGKSRANSWQTFLRHCIEDVLTNISNETRGWSTPWILLFLRVMYFSTLRQKVLVIKYQYCH